MIAIVKVGKLSHHLIERNAVGFSKQFYIRLHLRKQFRLTYSADGRVMVVHAYVVEVVKLAEDAQLREFGYARDKHKLKVRVERLYRTVEVLHYTAQLLQVVLLVYHIKQRSIIFVNKNDHLLTGLFASAHYKILQTLVGIFRSLLTSVYLLIFLKFKIQFAKKTFIIHVLRRAHVEVKHRMLHPLLLIISNGKTVKQFLAALEISLKS